VFAEDRGRQIPSAYGGWNLEAMDAHGAWIFSAVDMVRFASEFDDPKNCRILKESSIKTMFAPPEGLKRFGLNKEDPRQYYSLGWMNGPSTEGEGFNNWHMGSLPGTATLMMRRHDGRTFAILFNGRSSPNATHFGKAILADFSKALDNVEKWPKNDLFPKFGSNSSSK
jgi:N-acyl-D-amino-acid deacylase